MPHEISFRISRTALAARSRARRPDPCPACIARDYRALAERQNQAAWARQKDVAATAIDGRLEDSAHRAQARYLLARRDRLVSRINEIVDCPDLFWRHAYFRHCLGGIVVSAEEAVDEVRRMLALGTAPAEPLVAQAGADRRARGGAGVCPLFQALRPARVDARRRRECNQHQAPSPRVPPCAVPTTPRGAGASADRREFVGQHQQPERDHPEAEDRQEAEDAENDQRDADGDAQPARARQMEMAAEQMDLAGRRLASDRLADRTSCSRFPVGDQSGRASAGGGKPAYVCRLAEMPTIYRLPKKPRMLLCKAERGLL